MFFNKKGKLGALGLALALFFAAGCGKGTQMQGQQQVQVKAMQVIERDTNLINEYAGQIQGTNEVPVRSTVAGHVVEKMISGGQLVTKGQPLFKIDDRQYRSSYLSAQAQLSQSEANYANTQRDTERYRELYQSSAIAEQALTTQESLAAQQRAVVSANRALAQKASDDLNDTLVVSPIDGRLYVDDVSVGTYIQPGSTTLVTVGVLDPVFVQFNMSENEYLELRSVFNESISESSWGQVVTLSLSDGSLYPYAGQVTEIDRGLAANSGTLTVKASFRNPDGILLPGMFARASIEGLTLRNALLVPQRAIQQVLEKSYVMVVDEESKVKAKQVTLGRTVGSFWIVQSGLEPTDTVIVEGLTRIQEGASVTVQMVTPADLSLSFE